MSRLLVLALACARALNPLDCQGVKDAFQSAGCCPLAEGNTTLADLTPDGLGAPFGDTTDVVFKTMLGRAPTAGEDALLGPAGPYASTGGANTLQIQQTIFANPTLDAEFRAHKGLLTPAGGDSCVSVVVGASRGVGFATALELAKLGCQVYALARTQSFFDKYMASARMPNETAYLGTLYDFSNGFPAPGELPTVHENTSSMIYPWYLGQFGVTQEVQDRITFIPCDVRVEANVQAAVDQIVADGHGNITHLVNVVGMFTGLSQTPTLFDPATCPFYVSQSPHRQPHLVDMTDPASPVPYEDAFCTIVLGTHNVDTVFAQLSPAHKADMSTMLVWDGLGTIISPEIPDDFKPFYENYWRAYRAKRDSLRYLMLQEVRGMVAAGVVMTDFSAPIVAGLGSEEVPPPMAVMPLLNENGTWNAFYPDRGVLEYAYTQAFFHDLKMFPYAADYIARLLMHVLASPQPTELFTPLLRLDSVNFDEDKYPPIHFYRGIDDASTRARMWSATDARKLMEKNMLSGADMLGTTVH